MHRLEERLLLLRKMFPIIRKVNENKLESKFKMLAQYCPAYRFETDLNAAGSLEKFWLFVIDTSLKGNKREYYSITSSSLAPGMWYLSAKHARKIHLPDRYRHLIDHWIITSGLSKRGTKSWRQLVTCAIAVDMGVRCNRPTERWALVFSEDDGPINISEKIAALRGSPNKIVCKTTQLKPFEL